MEIYFSLFFIFYAKAESMLKMFYRYRRIPQFFIFFNEENLLKDFERTQGLQRFCVVLFIQSRLLKRQKQSSVNGNRA